MTETFIEIQSEHIENHSELISFLENYTKPRAHAAMRFVRMSYTGLCNGGFGSYILYSLISSHF